jgi:class 3 adenylate cyclase
VGINLGDAVEEGDGDLMGDVVNIAARLEGIAEPEGVCSRAQLMNGCVTNSNAAVKLRDRWSRSLLNGLTVTHF